MFIGLSYIFEIGGASKAKDEMTAFHEYCIDFPGETYFTEIFILFSLDFLGKLLDLFVEHPNRLINVR